MFHHVALPKLAKEVFVMCNYNELEVVMAFAFVDDTVWESRVRAGIPIRCKGSNTYSTRLAARASMLSVSSAFVGSSRARMPQF